jgi:hypothetical protein
MEFDSADLDFVKGNGDFSTCITHEMLHVIGFGTLWGEVGISGSCGSYAGANANAEYRAITGCSSVPIEQDGEPGTKCGHWDEVCLQTELMTGYLNHGSTIPLSRITIGSLEDIGYHVNYNEADAFTRNDVSPSCLCNRRLLEHGAVRYLRSTADDAEAPRPGARRLSEEARQVAANYGLGVLEQRSRSHHVAVPEGAEYVGDRLMAVLVKDGDSIFSVVVRRDA